MKVLIQVAILAIAISVGITGMACKTSKVRIPNTYNSKAFKGII